MGRVKPPPGISITHRAKKRQADFDITKRTRQRQQVLSPKVSKQVIEMRSQSKSNRFRKWVCSKCGQIARIASRQKHPGLIKHVYRYDQDGNQLPCGGSFIEVI